jgi:hypothetical protein
VDKCANYLLNHGAFLKYDDYLAAGFPIATGVIEGACRYLIKPITVIQSKLNKNVRHIYVVISRN